jgi:hypothetical protein
MQETLLLIAMPSANTPPASTFARPESTGLAAGCRLAAG